MDIKSKKQFKFEILWAEKEECGQIINEGWSSPFEGSFSFQWVQKLKKVSNLLLAWSKEVSPNNRKKIVEIKNKIADLQGSDMSEEGFIEVQQLIEELKVVWGREEKYWHQRSRINWMKYGDKNTRFFHQSTLQRRRRNKVATLKQDDGSWVEDEETIMDRFFEFYKSLYTSVGERDMGAVLDIVPKLVSDEMNEVLEMEVDEKEIMSAVYELGALKAPGPDGFNGFFYQKYWEIVKECIIKSVQSFFHSGTC